MVGTWVVDSLLGWRWPGRYRISHQPNDSLTLKTYLWFYKWQTYCLSQYILNWQWSCNKTKKNNFKNKLNVKRMKKRFHTQHNILRDNNHFWKNSIYLTIYLCFFIYPSSFHLDFYMEFHLKLHLVFKIGWLP